jgi:hypothetical protein
VRARSHRRRDRISLKSGRLADVSISPVGSGVSIRISISISINATTFQQSTLHGQPQLHGSLREVQLPALVGRKPAIAITTGATRRPNTICPDEHYLLMETRKTLNEHALLPCFARGDS